MKAARCFPPILVISSAILTALLVSACNTPTSSPATATTSTSATPQATRIAEHQSAYDALPAPMREQLARGLISQGQSLKLVYVALGRPDKILITPDGKALKWTYENYISPHATASKVIVGNKPGGIAADSSPLYDSLQAVNRGFLKREVPTSPEGTDMTKWAPQIVPKAPTQSWEDYGRYRERMSIGEARSGANDPDSPEFVARKIENKEAERAYQEALLLPPIVTPDPVKLDIIFIDQLVTDAVINDSISAFSSQPVSLPGTFVPGVQTQLAPD